MSIQRSNKNVSREKYESIKQKGTQWYDECEILKEKLEKLTDMNTDLLSQNEDLVDRLKDLADTPDQAPDTELIEELEKENKSLKREIRNLKRDNKTIVDKYSEKIVQLERDLFVKDGKIQRLEDAKRDLKERYVELKEDWREERRSNRKKD